MQDYPRTALRDEVEGTVGIRLVVGTDGVPIDCQILSTSGSFNLDDGTCSILMHRARFKPALDARGQPVTGAYSTRIAWKLPAPPAESEPSEAPAS